MKSITYKCIEVGGEKHRTPVWQRSLNSHSCRTIEPWADWLSHVVSTANLLSLKKKKKEKKLEELRDGYNMTFVQSCFHRKGEQKWDIFLKKKFPNIWCECFPCGKTLEMSLLFSNCTEKSSPMVVKKKKYSIKNFHKIYFPHTLHKLP